MDKKVSIILVNYNNYTDTIECIESLVNIEYEYYNIIVVDNASDNNSYDILRSRFPDINIIKSNVNLGFAGGNNVGIKYALEQGADLVLLLNNDTIVEKDFLTYMVSTILEDENIGMVCCKIKYYSNKDKIWFAGGNINWSRLNVKHIGQGEIDDGRFDMKKEINFATGCCLLIKKEVFEKVGLLSEEYFMYFEDVDLCVKVVDAGYKVIYEPKAVIYHKVGFSCGGEESEFALRWGNRNRIIFMKKYKKKFGKSYCGIILYFYTTRLIRIIQHILKGDIGKALAIIKGVKEGILYSFNIPRGWIKWNMIWFVR